MTVKEFARDMMIDCETYCKPCYMTVASAAFNLKCYRDEGRKLPRGINPKNFADAWNDKLPVDENSVQAEAQGIADQLPYKFSVYEALAVILLNLKSNGHAVSGMLKDIQGICFSVDYETFKLVRNKADKVWKVRPTE